MPDGWVEHMSGIRTIGRSFGTAPTVAASRAAGTPASLSSPALTWTLDKRWLWGGALAVALAGIAGLLALRARSASEDAMSPSVSPFNAVTAETTPPTPATSEPTLVAPPSAVPAQLPPPGARAASAAQTETSAPLPKTSPSTGKAKAPEPVPTSGDKSVQRTAEPSTDLLAPY
jgi:hypothetical protein